MRLGRFGYYAGGDKGRRNYIRIDRKRENKNTGVSGSSSGESGVKWKKEIVHG